MHHLPPFLWWICLSVYPISVLLSLPNLTFETKMLEAGHSPSEAQRRCARAVVEKVFGLYLAAGLMAYIEFLPFPVIQWTARTIGLTLLASASIKWLKWQMSYRSSSYPETQTKDRGYRTDSDTMDG